MEGRELIACTTRTENVGSIYGNISFSGTANANLSEFRGSARQSRISLLAEGQVGSAKLSGYYQMDFLGAAPTRMKCKVTASILAMKAINAAEARDRIFRLLATAFIPVLPVHLKRIARFRSCPKQV
jgi:hypothetical protein